MHVGLSWLRMDALSLAGAAARGMTPPPPPPDATLAQRKGAGMLGDLGM